MCVYLIGYIYVCILLDIYIWKCCFYKDGSVGLSNFSAASLSAEVFVSTFPILAEDVCRPWCVGSYWGIDRSWGCGMPDLVQGRRNPFHVTPYRWRYLPELWGNTCALPIILEAGLDMREGPEEGGISCVCTANVGISNLLHCPKLLMSILRKERAVHYTLPLCLSPQGL